MEDYKMHSLQVVQVTDDNGNVSYNSGYTVVPATKGTYKELKEMSNLEEQLKAGVNLKQVNPMIHTDTIDGLADTAALANGTIEQQTKDEE